MRHERGNPDTDLCRSLHDLAASATRPRCSGNSSCRSCWCITRGRPPRRERPPARPCAARSSTRQIDPLKYLAFIAALFMNIRRSMGRSLGACRGGVKGRRSQSSAVICHLSRGAKSKAQWQPRFTGRAQQGKRGARSVAARVPPPRSGSKPSAEAQHAPPGGDARHYGRRGVPPPRVLGWQNVLRARGAAVLQTRPP